MSELLQLHKTSETRDDERFRKYFTLNWIKDLISSAFRISSDKHKTSSSG